MGRRSTTLQPSGTLLTGPSASGGLWEGFPVHASNVSAASVYVNDFLTQFDEDDIILTQVTSGTGDIVADMEGGQYQLAAPTDNQGPNCQITGAETAAEGFGVPAAGKVISWEARVQMDNLAATDWFIGVGETDTTFMSAAGVLLANGADNHIGFHHLVADAGVADLSYAGTAVANQADATALGAAASALSNDTWYRFGARLSGTTDIQFFLDGLPVSAVTTSGTALADGLVPTFCQMGGVAAALMAIDYFVMAQTRLSTDGVT